MTMCKAHAIGSQCSYANGHLGSAVCHFVDSQWVPESVTERMHRLLLFHLHRRRRLNRRSPYLIPGKYYR